MTTVPSPEPAPPAPINRAGMLEHAHATFRSWLGDDYDVDALDVTLAVAAGEQLSGDPAWLMVVSGSGNAKTETVASLAGAGAHTISTIASEGALLSGTSSHARKKTATGGLLQKIGDRGLLVVKDFTSLLAMNRDTRAGVLAALREVYDGKWVRNLGTDGGLTLEWTGRVVVVAASTTAYDTAHAVISAMGDRFVVLRMNSAEGRTGAGRQAMLNVGKETRMRTELADATKAVLTGIDEALAAVTEPQIEALLGAADLVTLARTAIERDYQGRPVEAHAPEMPTRFAKMLVQIVRGAVAIGVTPDRALELALRVARDSVPPTRLVTLLDVAAHGMTRLSEVVKRIQRPRTTVDRTLQELHLIGLLVVEYEQHEGRGESWLYSLASGVELSCLGSDQKCQ